MTPSDPFYYQWKNTPKSPQQFSRWKLEDTITFKKNSPNSKILQHPSCSGRLDKERSGLKLVLQKQTQIKKVDEWNVKPPQFAQNFYLFLSSTLNFCGWDKIGTESKQAGFAKAPQLFSKNKIKEIL